MPPKQGNKKQQQRRAASHADSPPHPQELLPHEAACMGFTLHVEGGGDGQAESSGVTPPHKMDFLKIDASLGEGGGQILRTSLALSCLTRRPLHLINIRGKRSNPGLQAQHLTCVQAAATVGCARTIGARLLSSELFFIPQVLFENSSAHSETPAAVFPWRCEGGSHRFEIDTAGSTILVLQTLLPILLLAKGPSTVSITGGTHTAMAPPVEFFHATLEPLLAAIGFKIATETVRVGVYPVGGGEIKCHVEPIEFSRSGMPLLNKLKFHEVNFGKTHCDDEEAVKKKKLESKRLALAHTVNLFHTQTAEAAVASGRKAGRKAVTEGFLQEVVDGLEQTVEDLQPHQLTKELARAPGSSVLCFERFTAQVPLQAILDKPSTNNAVQWAMLFTSTDSKKPATIVNRALEQRHGYFFGPTTAPSAHSFHSALHDAAHPPCDEYLTDQLLLPLVLGVGGSYRTRHISLHTVTNIWVIQQFFAPTAAATSTSENADSFITIVKKKLAPTAGDDDDDVVLQLASDPNELVEAAAHLVDSKHVAPGQAFEIRVAPPPTVS